MRDAGKGKESGLLRNAGYQACMARSKYRLEYGGVGWCTGRVVNRTSNEVGAMMGTRMMGSRGR